MNMKKAYLLLAILLCPLRIALADTAPAEEGKLSPQLLRQAMADAELEYDAAAKASPKLPVVKEKASAEDIGSVISNLTKATQVGKGTLLEDLANQVDALKSKLAVEKATLLATQSPRKVRVRGAKTIFNYRDDAVYQITAAPFHVCDVQLRPGEALTSIPSSGDVSGWNIGVMKSGNVGQEVTHLIIRPLDDNIETNLIVTTDQHVYHIKLQSGDYAMPAVSWTYPEDNHSDLEGAIKKPDPQGPPQLPTFTSAKYEVNGHSYSWKPLRVLDDGMKTWIQMPKDVRVREAPVLFILEDGSDPMLTNYRKKGDYYIVDRLFSKAEIRVGADEKVKIELDDGRGFFSRLFN